MAKDIFMKQKEIFEIDLKRHLARWHYLRKSIIEHLKVANKNSFELHRNMPISLRKGLQLTSSDEEQVLSSIDNIIGASIVRLICYEGENNNSDMCKDVKAKGYCPEYDHLYKLANEEEKLMKKEIFNFIDLYKNLLRDKDIENEIYDEAQTALRNTLREADKSIDNIINVKFSDQADKKICMNIKNQYDILNTIGLSKVMGKGKTKLTPLKKALETANMNYVIDLGDGYIYPFLYDLIIMSFSLRLSVAIYNKPVRESSSLATMVLEMHSSPIDKNTTTYYLYIELLRLIEGLPEEIKEFNNFLEDDIEKEQKDDVAYIHPTTILIIKHYSEVLKVPCEEVLSVFHQLAFHKNSKKRKVENMCTGKFKNINLSFHKDSLRDLSLFVI